MDRFQPLVLVTLSLIPLVVAAMMVHQPVSRTRVERFAQRHRLVVTADNGQRVIDYLATTRRWRAIGLAAGLAASLAWHLPQMRIGVNWVFMLAGWFVGALIAELRVARLTSSRSAAVLVPRSADRYLPPVALRAAPVAAASCAALILALTVAEGLGAAAGRVAWGQALSLLVAALTATTAVWVAQRHVLTRAQPVAAPDVIQADNAVRSRSLHALSGSGTALALYCALGLADVIAVALPDLTGLATAVNVIGAFAIPLLGWRIATRPWPTAGPEDLPAARHPAPLGEAGR
jgi:hypothetical protein